MRRTPGIRRSRAFLLLHTAAISDRLQCLKELGNTVDSFQGWWGASATAKVRICYVSNERGALTVHKASSSSKNAVSRLYEASLANVRRPEMCASTCACCISLGTVRRLWRRARAISDSLRRAALMFGVHRVSPIDTSIQRYQNQAKRKDKASVRVVRCAVPKWRG